jgi:hypothetical protein
MPRRVYIVCDLIGRGGAGLRVDACGGTVRHKRRPLWRGYGTTRFRSAHAPRNGRQGALATDVTALMDTLKTVVRRLRLGASGGCEGPSGVSFPCCSGDGTVNEFRSLFGDG